MYIWEAREPQEAAFSKNIHAGGVNPEAGDLLRRDDGRSIERLAHPVTQLLFHLVHFQVSLCDLLSRRGANHSTTVADRVALAPKEQAAMICRRPHAHSAVQ